jgi:zinc transport system permease protein
VSRLWSDFAIRAYIAGALVGVAAPLVGSFLVQRRLSLVGDGMGHLAFAGVAIGVALGIAPVWGAVVVAILGALLLERLRARGRLASDLSLALIFYFGLALGSVVLSLVGRFDTSAVGILFGSIYTTTLTELWVIFALCATVTVTVVVLFKELLAIALDEETARASGLPVDVLNVLLVVMVALLVAAGMRVVGLLLIAALMVVPVATGSRLAHSFHGATRWGVAAGVASALGGLGIAIAQGELAPGGTIVLTAIALFIAAALVGRRAARLHTRQG